MKIDGGSDGTITTKLDENLNTSNMIPTILKVGGADTSSPYTVKVKGRLIYISMDASTVNGNKK